MQKFHSTNGKQTWMCFFFFLLCKTDENVFSFILCMFYFTWKRTNFMQYDDANKKKDFKPFFLSFSLSFSLSRSFSLFSLRLSPTFPSCSLYLSHTLSIIFISLLFNFFLNFFLFPFIPNFFFILIYKPLAVFVSSLWYLLSLYFFSFSKSQLLSQPTTFCGGAFAKSRSSKAKEGPSGKAFEPLSARAKA